MNNTVWVCQQDAGTIVGGIFIGGAGFFGSLSVAQLSAGTANFAGTVTFQSGGSGPSVEINSTDVIIGSGSGLCSVDISSSAVTISNGDLVIQGTGGVSATYDGGGITANNPTASPALVLNWGELMMYGLPSSSPGAGSKKFYYDPATGIVHFAY
jgi:hypothetical protein